MIRSFKLKLLKKLAELSRKHGMEIVEKHNKQHLEAMGKIGDYKNAPQQVIDYELDPRPRKTNIAIELKTP